jgi:hypothetical protein
VIAVEVPAHWFGRKIPLTAARGGRQGVTEAPTTSAIMERQLRPPLRRWAANRLLRRLDGSIAELEAAIDQLSAADAAAVVRGMCDAVEVLDDDTAAAVLTKAVSWPQAQVRKAALDLLIARGAGDRAHRLGRTDPDAKIRRWGHGGRHRSRACSTGEGRHAVLTPPSSDGCVM